MFDIIPAIDIIEGSCVRLTRGDYGSKTIYSADPVETARAFEDAGLKRLHLVDLDGAASGGIVNHQVLSRIASRTGLIIDFGGGIKRDEDIRCAFESGAAMVTGGSVAVKNPELFSGWIERYGPDRIILGADVSRGYVALSGWKERSTLTAEQLVLSYLKKGITQVISTEISRDGTLEGPSFELYDRISQAAREAGCTDLELIASGGVSSAGDLLTLSRRGLRGVIVGKAFYEGRITLEQLSRMQQETNQI